MNPDEAKQLIARISRRLDWLGLLANGFGAAVVFMAVGFVLAIFFDASERDALGRENAPFVAGGLLVLGAIVIAILKRRERQALAWLVEGREPTDEEYRRTLGMPAYTAYVTAAAWGLGALIGGLLNLDHSVGTAVLIAVAFWLGGETTSALGFLLSERVRRPLTALALQARPPVRSVTPGVRNRMLFAWSLGTAVPVMSVLVVGLAGLAKPDVDSNALAAACVFLGGVALIVGFITTVATARSLADPLTTIRVAVERIAAGDLAAEVPIDDASEVGLLQAGFNRMAEGLRERERIRDLFGRQVGQDVAKAALRDGIRFGGEEREIGALYVDLTGSTSMALAMPPTQVVRLLNKFFRVVIEVVESEGGFVNKFEGDAALCVFGAPAPSEDPAGQALSAARALAARLEREVPEIGFGIGVSAGPAVAGNVGSEHRFEYTVIGDPVNEAARLSDLAKERDELVIASNAAIERAGEAEAEVWDVGDRAILQGRIDATGLALPRA